MQYPGYRLGEPSDNGEYAIVKNRFALVKLWAGISDSLSEHSMYQQGSFVSAVPIVFARTAIVILMIAASAQGAPGDSAQEKGVAVDAKKAGQGIAATMRYSPAVVAKADKIFEQNGLRRSGKSIQSTKVSDISRAISGLSRQKRELKLVQEDWKMAEDAVKLNRKQSLMLTRQNGELSLQLARATTTAINNRLVGLINANTAQQRLLKDQLEKLREYATTKRSELSKVEASYAETVLKIREDLTEIGEEIVGALNKKKVRTAISVAHANYGVPLEQSAGVILKSVERRLGKIEQEIFSEVIPLRVENRSMYVDVVVGGKTTPMVLDSGASIVSLPSKTAIELGVLVPEDAPQLQLMTADGRSIMGRRVTLANVRIGNFEAENVDAAVLSETASSAEPLLGMSFLGNFKFEIDSASKTLKMLRVQAE
jgi:aspartyl protease family protein